MIHVNFDLLLNGFRSNEAMIRLTIARYEILLVGGEKVPSLGCIARFPLPGREFVDEKVPSGYKFLWGDSARLFELGIAEDGREIVPYGPEMSLVESGVISASSEGDGVRIDVLGVSRAFCGVGQLEAKEARYWSKRNLFRLNSYRIRWKITRSSVAVAYSAAPR